MCLGVPGKILEITEEEPLRTGRVAFGGAVKKVVLAYVPEAEVGDYVVVHVGFALSKMDEEEAQRVFSYLEEIDALHEIEDREMEARGELPKIPGDAPAPSEAAKASTEAEGGGEA